MECRLQSGARHRSAPTIGSVLSTTDYEIARLLIERGLGAIYLIGFVVAFVQFPALAGERGLDPAPDFLSVVGFRKAPSIFHLRYSDNLLRAVAAIGALLSAAVVVGLVAQLPLVLTMIVWLTLWALYLSIMNIGGTFYGFGWESQLSETGFVAIFLGNATFAPPFVVLLLFRWIAFRVEFGAGLIKLRGDACWRKLTCMEYHHETQPLPNPLSWFAHHAPLGFHRVEALGNFVAQLALPFGLFLPQPFASIAAALMILTQLYLVVTGNYSWLNWITIVALVAGLSDSTIATILPGLVPAAAASAAGLVHGSGRNFRDRRRRALLLARAQPAEQPTSNESVVQRVASREHLRRVRQRDADALRGDRRGH